MRAPRLTAAAALLAAAAATAACGPARHATPAPTRTPVAHPWPGQLTGPAAAAATVTGPAKPLVRDKSGLARWTPAQVEGAWAQVRQLVADTGTAPSLVDPTGTVSSGQVTAVLRGRLSPTATAAIAKIVPAALAGDGAAAQVLRPMLLWYDARDEQAASPLRLATRPFGTFVITAASATGLAQGGHTALAFDVQSELTLHMVDAAGKANTLFLTRDLRVAMVPGPPGGRPWLVDAWTGSWQVTKPVGQKLPAATPDAAHFSPGAGGVPAPSPAPTTPATPSR